MKRYLLLSLLVLLLVAACSGGGQSATPLPSPTTIPTYAYVPPTLVARIQEIATEESTEAPAAATVDPQVISAGQGRYVALDCGSCHGDNAQGNGDKGPTLVWLTLSEDDFLTFMRSGGKLGTSHQYASNKLSAGGAHNLYEYLKSLG